MKPVHRRFGRRRRAWALALGLLAAPLFSPPARAWDPTTTGRVVLDAALRRSGLHLRWMEASGLSFGLFSPLRVDPAQLDPRTRAWLGAAVRAAHEDAGAVPRGGPGACPGADAPTELLRDCVSGDLWELDAIGWMRLGMVAESEPRARLLHHFVNPEDPQSLQWGERSGPRRRAWARQVSRAGGESAASRAAGTSFDGRNASALAFLADPSDPLGPAAVAAHQRMAALALDPEVRAHHRALSLVAMGATLRVIMDAGLPAYARGDLEAFANPLSDDPADRGEAMSEYVSVRFAHDLPIDPVAAGTRPTGRSWAAQLSDHIVAPDDGQGHEGLARFSARHFLSPGSLPEPIFIEPGTGGRAALRRWLGDESLGLDSVELEGAKLSPWPSDRGYLLNASGRPLFAYTLDEAGWLRAHIDEAVMADAAAHLLPRMVDATASAIDWLGAGFPPPVMQGDGLVWIVEVADEQREAQLHLFAEDASGQRHPLARQPLRAGQANRLVGTPEPGEGRSLIFVLEWRDPEGRMRAAEHRANPT